MLSDSTNAERPGFTMSEKVVGNTFDDLFGEMQGRIIITTFASNVHRIQQVIRTAEKYNRKVAVAGPQHGQQRAGVERTRLYRYSPE